MHRKFCYMHAGHGSDRNTDFLSTSGPRLLENLQVQAVPSSLFLPLPSVVVVMPIVLRLASMTWACEKFGATVIW